MDAKYHVEARSGNGLPLTDDQAGPTYHNKALARSDLPPTNPQDTCCASVLESSWLCPIKQEVYLIHK